MIELGGRRRLAAGAVGVWASSAPSRRSTVVVALVLLFVADRIFKFEAVLPIMTPVLLIGGMTTGLFTPTEGAIAACVWALFLGLVWYRTLTWKHVRQGLAWTRSRRRRRCCSSSPRRRSSAGCSPPPASPQAIAAWVLAFTKEPWMFLLLANLLMLFVGCFLEPTAAITILVPILLPIAVQLGIDPVHFGLVMVLNLMIGLLHPPMGMVLFVLARGRQAVERTTMAILPWLVPLLVEPRGADRTFRWRVAVACQFQ